MIHRLRTKSKNEITRIFNEHFNYNVYHMWYTLTCLACGEKNYIRSNPEETHN